MRRRNFEIRTEIRMSLFHFRFLLGMALLVIVFLADAYPIRSDFIGAGGCLEGPPWIVIFRLSISSERSLLFLPLAVPLAAAEKAQEELKSRYTVFLISRAGRKKYLIGKAAGAALSGGIMTVAALGITLIVFRIWCAEIPDLSIPAMLSMVQQQTAGADTIADTYQALTSASLIPGFVCGFFNGAFWALAGSVVSVFARNCYLGYAVPFILYYVLTVFQERYFGGLHFLSPKQWAYPSYYRPYVCVVILLLLTASAFLLLIKLMERRLTG